MNTLNILQALAAGFKLKNIYHFECRNQDGDLKWIDSIENDVVNVGLDDILDKYWKGSTYTAQHYIGLTDGAPVTVAAGDTMASHAGWAEVQNYSEATRPDLTAVLGTVSGQSVASTAISFSINATVTLGGAFLTTNNTKGGTTGTLVGAGAFSGGDKTADNGDTLNVTVTLTAATA